MAQYCVLNIVDKIIDWIEYSIIYAIQPVASALMSPAKFCPSEATIGADRLLN